MAGRPHPVEELEWHGSFHRGECIKINIMNTVIYAIFEKSEILIFFFVGSGYERKRNIPMDKIEVRRPVGFLRQSH
jgi:hypothetical protein